MPQPSRYFRGSQLYKGGLVGAGGEGIEMAGRGTFGRPQESSTIFPENSIASNLMLPTYTPDWNIGGTEEYYESTPYTPPTGTGIQTARSELQAAKTARQQARQGLQQARTGVQQARRGVQKARRVGGDVQAAKQARQAAKLARQQAKAAVKKARKGVKLARKGVKRARKQG